MHSDEPIGIVIVNGQEGEEEEEMSEEEEEEEEEGEETETEMDIQRLIRAAVAKEKGKQKKKWRRRIKGAQDRAVDIAKAQWIRTQEKWERTHNTWWGNKINQATVVWGMIWFALGYACNVGVTFLYLNPTQSYVFVSIVGVVILSWTFAQILWWFYPHTHTALSLRSLFRVGT